MARRLRTFTKKILIGVNVLIALLFIAGASVGFFDQRHWWFLGLFTFILPYLLVLLFFFIIFWLYTKPILTSISILTIIAGWPAIRNVFTVNFSATFHIEKDPASLRVMSWNVEQFNVQHHKDEPWLKQQMLDLINHYDPDIACFQEVVAGEKKNSLNYFSDIYGQLNFTDYFYSYDIRNDFDKDHHFGILIFSKLPVVAKQTFINYPNDYNSTFQYIDVLKGQDTIRIFNIHLQSLKFSKSNLNYLEKGNFKTDTTITESRSIISKIKTAFIKRAIQADFIKGEINQSPFPVVVCGDFNDVPDSYAYETLVQGLQDTYVQKGFGISRTFSSLSPTLRIDNIFAERSFGVTQFTRIKKSLSDHFPIIADLAPGKNIK